MTVLQLIAKAGGLNEYADKKNIVVVRVGPSGQQSSFKVNYENFWGDPKKLPQNIFLQVGDTVVVK